MNIKTAIVTFDADRAEQLEADAEARPLGWIFMQALNGRDYPRERGIVSIEITDELVVLPRLT